VICTSAYSWLTRNFNDIWRPNFKSAFVRTMLLGSDLSMTLRFKCHCTPMGEGLYIYNTLHVFTKVCWNKGRQLVNNNILQFIPLSSRISLPCRSLTGFDVLIPHLADMRHVHHSSLPLGLEHLWQCAVDVYDKNPLVLNCGDVG
jgi:hypothetical protein